MEILKAKGIPALLLDLSGFDDDEPLTIDERIHESFKGVDLTRQVVVVTGYTKGVEGIMREFDRGYSEVTFSKVAVELKADEAVIHKEFHLSSADPAIVGAGNTVVVGNTNYDVADQLADVGMEAIHPKAAKPMELAGISIRLKNTFEPDHPGTLITKDYVGKQARIEVIAGTPRVTIVEIHDPSMVGTVGFDLGLMQIFQRHGVSLHPQGHQRQLHHPRHLGEVGHRQLHRGAGEHLRAGHGGAGRGGLRHRLQHRHPRRAGPRGQRAGGERHQRQLRVAVAAANQHAVRHRPGRLQEGHRGAQQGALPGADQGGLIPRGGRLGGIGQPPGPPQSEPLTHTSVRCRLRPGGVP